MPQVLKQSIPEKDSLPDFLPLNGTDYVEFYVGNARQSAHFYRSAFGFRLAAYRGPETGYQDEAVHVLESGGARFVFRGPARARTRLGQRVAAHGDGVMDLALEVEAHDATGVDVGVQPFAQPAKIGAPVLIVADVLDGLVSTHRAVINKERVVLLVAQEANTGKQSRREGTVVVVQLGASTDRAGLGVNLVVLEDHDA